MYEDFPYIKIFQLITGNYIYDVNKNSLIKIHDNKVFQQILEINKYGWSSFLDKNDVKGVECRGLRLLIDKGYLRGNNVERIDNINYNVCRTYTDNCIDHMILQVTQNCNLKCSYCPYAWDGYMERQHNKKSMSWETAKKALDFFILNSYESKDLAVSFYGGEPLLEFELIKKCIVYITSIVKSKPISFHMTTNGTLITREFLNFISNYNFGIYISLDGPKTVQNTNRKFGINGEGSFENVYGNLKIIANEYPQIIERFYFNAVWDGFNDIDEIINFFEHDNVITKFGGYNIDFADDNAIMSDISISEHNYYLQQQQYFDYLVSLVKKADCPAINNSITKMKDGIIKFKEQFSDKSPLSKIRFQSGPCIPGCAKLFVDVNGALFPCEKTCDKCVSIGNINDRSIIDYFAVQKQMNLNGMVSEKCKTCWAFRFCKICSIFAANGDAFSDIILSDECQLNIHHLANSMRNHIYLHELKMI